jgi:hypothetical protein
MFAGMTAEDGGTEVNRLIRMLAISMAIAVTAIVVRPMVNPDAVVLAAPPKITNVSPNNGPTGGGTKIVIYGSNFKLGATVTFDSILGPVPALSVLVKSSTTIEAVTPQAPTLLLLGLIPGSVDVTVTTTDGPFTLANGFTYRWGTTVPPPNVVNITPNSGPITGGTNIVITGSNFRPTTRVFFGSFLTPIEATSTTVVSSAQIRATTPPVVGPGPVPVFVVTPASYPNSFASQIALIIFLLANPGILAENALAVLNNGIAFLQNGFVYR